MDQGRNILVVPECKVWKAEGKALVNEYRSLTLDLSGRVSKGGNNKNSSWLNGCQHNNGGRDPALVQVSKGIVKKKKCVCFSKQ